MTIFDPALRRARDDPDGRRQKTTSGKVSRVENKAKHLGIKRPPDA